METDFVQGARDLHLLLNRGYPKGPAVKLVGDRYRLQGVDRIILYRGVFSSGEARARSGRRCPDPGRKTLQVDGYNLLFTLINYLTGRPLFIANDGFLRDAGSYRRDTANQHILSRALTGMASYLLALRPREMNIYLDHSIPDCRRHGASLRRGLGPGFRGRISPVPSADDALVRTGKGIIVTSDTMIIDNSPLMATDLRGILRRSGPIPSLPVSDGKFLDLQKILAG